MSAVPLLLIEVTVVLGIAILGVRHASEARAAVRHLILASAFGVVLILPLATLVSPQVAVQIPAFPALVAEPVDAEPAASAPATPGPTTAERNPATTNSITPVNAAASIPAATWLLLIWAAIAVIALVPVGASLSHLRRIRRGGLPWPEGSLRIAGLAEAAGLRPPSVVLHDGIAGPITTGFLRPVIALPSSAVQWSRTNVDNALVHELEHVRRRDWPVHLTARMVCALYWFHPLAWLAWRELRLEAERACDDAVLQREDAATYAEQLLALARQMAHQPTMPGLSMAGSSDLSRRIKSVLDHVRPRGRAGQVAIACTVLAALAAIAVLAPLRVFQDFETQMYRATDVLAQRTDPDSLAAAAALNAHKYPERALDLIEQASLMAPGRADLAWLHVQLCLKIASCDPEPIEDRLRVLDPSNGAAWLVTLARSADQGDEAARNAALEAIARAGRVDIYWNQLISRLSPPLASTRALPRHAAMEAVIGSLAATTIPGLGDLSAACSKERLTPGNERELCRGVADSLLNGDSFLVEMIGGSLAKRAWPENSLERTAADQVKRTRDHMMTFADDATKWARAHPDELLHLYAQHRREQDVHNAMLIEIGKDPFPPAGDQER